MRLKTTLVVVALIGLTIAADLMIPRDTTAGKWRNPFRKRTSVEQLAEKIDDLEEHIDTYGSVVAKKPDIWGESRLMQHRVEFEDVMKTMAAADKFNATISASISRSDQAFLAQAFSLSSALGGGGPVPPAVTTTTTTKSSESFAPKSGEGGLSGNNSTDTVREEKPGTAPKPVTAADPKDLVSDFKTESGVISRASTTLVSRGFGKNGVALEPTVALDQMSRYLKHLHNLRRLNDGGDTADAPGYALHLVRIPVSILPGKKTRQGYGAEVTMTITPDFSEDFLPKTFRSLVINDVADQLALPLTKALNDTPSLTILKKYYSDWDRGALDKQFKVEHSDKCAPSPEIASTRDSVRGLDFTNSSIAPKPASIDSPVLAEQKQRVKAYQGVASQHYLKYLAREGLLNDKTAHLPAELYSAFKGGSSSRLKRHAVNPTSAFDVFGERTLGRIVFDAERFVAKAGGMYHYSDVHRFLVAELHAAYEFLNRPKPERADLWSHCTVDLVSAIKQRRRSLTDYRFSLATEHGSRFDISLKCLRKKYFDDIVRDYPRSQHTTTTSLAWAIIVESALLNEHLHEDMKAAAKRCVGECGWDAGTVHQFFRPHVTPEARHAFEQYVRCRWPIHVFAIDPVTEDQNVADAFSRRRETQLALSLAFAGGQVGANSFTRLARRLELDMESIALNRTMVGFSHGDDTFGWRFYPRVQSPPTRGNLTTFLNDNIIGGPTRDTDLKYRMLEPGSRECTALVIMPSFLPRILVDMRSNWFKLTNPRSKTMTLEDSVELSKSIRSMHQLAERCVKDAHRYRDGAVWRLRRAIHQLDARLPLQTSHVDVPFENTSGGFELFSSGVTDLGPELLGFYGSPGVKTGDKASTAVFLVGNNFSVHNTRVIAGNKDVTQTAELLSRQVMRVVIPGDVHTTPRGVDVHVATPYGVSSHLHIPLVPPEAPPAPAVGFAWKSDIQRLVYVKYAADGSVAKATLAAGDDGDFTIVGFGGVTGQPFDVGTEFAAFLYAVDVTGKRVKLAKLPIGIIAVTFPKGKNEAKLKFKGEFLNQVAKAVLSVRKQQQIAFLDVEGFIRLKDHKTTMFQLGNSLVIGLKTIP